MAVVADPRLARLPDPVPAMLTTTLRLDRRRQRGQDEQGEEEAPTRARYRMSSREPGSRNLATNPPSHRLIYRHIYIHIYIIMHPPRF